jgi:hypothetical protein
LSDQEGLFQCDCSKPNGHVSIDARKDGYESSEGVSVYTAVRKTSEGEPAVIVLRKIGETSFLLHSPFFPQVMSGWFGSRDKKEIHAAFDMLLRTDRWIPRDAVPVGDFVLDATQRPAQDGWEGTFTATNRTVGLIWSDRLLYQAPTEGYVTKIPLTAPRKRIEKKYLYLKLRDPEIYARICFQYGCGNSPELMFNYLFVLNPYGGRTFEYDERYDQFWREKPQWVEDAKAALREGRYPEKIDIDALIKAKEESAKKSPQ